LIMPVWRVFIPKIRPCGRRSRRGDRTWRAAGDCRIRPGEKLHESAHRGREPPLDRGRRHVRRAPEHPWWTDHRSGSRQAARGGLCLLERAQLHWLTVDELRALLTDPYSRSTSTTTTSPRRGGVEERLAHDGQNRRVRGQAGRGGRRQARRCLRERHCGAARSRCGCRIARRSRGDTPCRS